MLLRPGEAAQAVGIKPSTLRVYAQRFAELLSDEASDQARLYTARDVETLRRAKELIARGYTYERALDELRGAPRARAAAPIAEPSPVSVGLQALQGAVEAWRQLAEERANEIAELRAEMRRLQDMLTQGTHLTPIPRAQKQG